MTFANVQRQQLSDNSAVFNVVIPGNEYNADVTIGAIDERHAHIIADAINAGASWVVA